jgi:hypothetical protein
VGAAKLLVVARGLRAARPELFDGYRPVFDEGRLGEHVLAFDRCGAVTVATRLPVGLSRPRRVAGTPPCHSMATPGRKSFTNTVYGGDRLAVGDTLTRTRVALLGRIMTVYEVWRRRRTGVKVLVAGGAGRWKRGDDGWWRLDGARGGPWAATTRTYIAG